MKKKGSSRNRTQNLSVLSKDQDLGLSLRWKFPPFCVYLAFFATHLGVWFLTFPTLVEMRLINFHEGSLERKKAKSSQQAHGGIRTNDLLISWLTPKPVLQPLPKLPKAMLNFDIVLFQTKRRSGSRLRSRSRRASTGKPGPPSQRRGQARGRLTEAKTGETMPKVMGSNPTSTLIAHLMPLLSWRAVVISLKRVG